VLAPLATLAPALARAKRRGFREYGNLSMRYVREFDRKWLRGGAPADEPLLGSVDVQALADLDGAYAVVRQMRVLPFSWRTVSLLAVATTAPLVPLLFLVIPLEEMVDWLVQFLL
jgi:hypothetical protein